MAERIPEVSPDDDVSRFILQRSQFSAENRRVKYSAWLPNRQGKTSVFITSKLSDAQVWELGETHVARPREKPLYARGIVQAKAIQANGLIIDFDDDPPGHANILDWPEEKSEKKMIAIEIAESATLQLKE